MSILESNPAGSGTWITWIKEEVIRIHLTHKKFLSILLSVTCESPGEKGFKSCRLLYCVKQQLCVHLLNTSKKIVITFLDASKSEPGGTFTNVPIRINIRQPWKMFQNRKTACPWFLCTWRRLPKRRVKSPRVTRQNSAAMRSDISQSGGKMGPCRSSNSMRWRFSQLKRLSTLSSHACSSLSLKRQGHEISTYLGF